MKSNEEILKETVERLRESLKNAVFDLNQPNRNCRIYAKEVVENINEKLKNYDGPIMVEQEDGKRIPLTDPEIIFNPRMSNDRIVSFSIVGKIGGCKDICIDKNVKL